MGGVYFFAIDLFRREGLIDLNQRRQFDGQLKMDHVHHVQRNREFVHHKLRVMFVWCNGELVQHCL